MRNRRVILFFILLLSTIFVIGVIHLLKPDKNNWIDVIIAVSFPILIGVALYAFLPLLDEFISKRNEKCIIYLYGAAGVGKTTLIYSWFTVGNKVHQTTNGIKRYTGKVTNTSWKKFTVSVIDYRGQKPSMVTTKIPKSFIFNAAIFIVDIVGRYDDSTPSKLLDTPEKQLSWLSTNTETKIHKRKQEHLHFINKGMLEIVFSVISSHNLKSVKLVINKCDLLEQLLENQCLPNPQNLTSEEYAKKIFKDIEKEIETACLQQDSQPNFSVEVISTNNTEETNKILQSILDQYENLTNNP